MNISSTFIRIAVAISMILSMLSAPLAASAELVPTAHAAAADNIKSMLNTVAGSGNNSIFPTNDITKIATNIVRAFFALLAIIFLGMMLYGGYNWLTAMGEEDKVTKAKDTITSAIIGIAIIVASYAITVFVIDRLYGTTTSGGGNNAAAGGNNSGG